MEWDRSYIPYCYLYDERGIRQWMNHAVYYGRCLNCSRTLDDVLEYLVYIEGNTMPRLSDVMSGADVTWGEQYEKGALRGVAFWIHNARENSYPNPDPKSAASQPIIDILVLDITLNGPSRRDPHAVITVGNSPERGGMLAYFNDPNGNREPLGPCHTFEVPLKAGRSFWRIEDYDEEILDAQGVLPDDMQFDAHGKPILSSGK